MDNHVVEFSGKRTGYVKKRMTVDREFLYNFHWPELDAMARQNGMVRGVHYRVAGEVPEDTKALADKFLRFLQERDNQNQSEGDGVPSPPARAPVRPQSPPARPARSHHSPTHSIDSHALRSALHVATDGGRAVPSPQEAMRVLLAQTNADLIKFSNFKLVEIKRANPTKAELADAILNKIPAAKLPATMWDFTRELAEMRELLDLAAELGVKCVVAASRQNTRQNTPAPQR